MQDAASTLDDALVELVRKTASVEAAARARGLNFEKRGPELRAKCPFHDDSDPSFRINVAKNVWNCDPCRAKKIMRDGDGDAIGFVRKYDRASFAGAVTTLQKEQHINLAPPPPREQMKVVARYEYTNAAGVVLATKERLEHVPRHGKVKELRWKTARGFGRPETWTPTLYNLPAVITAIGEGTPVLVVEGEKCVDALGKLGFVATCNEDGAGKWTPAHAELLRDAKVVVLPDNDKEGREHANVVIASLEHAKSAAAVILEGLPSKGDVVDWLDAGGTKQQLAALVEEAYVEGAIAKAKRDLEALKTKKTDKRRRLLGKSMLDLMKAPRLQVPQLIKGLVPCAGLGMLGGEAKAAKTWIGAELLLAGASGTPAFGVLEVERPFSSLAIFIEDGEANIQVRCQALARGRNMQMPERDEDDEGPRPTVFDLLHMDRIKYEARESINLADDDDAALIIASARDMPEPPAIIYIDPLRDAHDGEENSSDDMRRVMHGIRRIRDLTGATILFPHHMSKPAKDKIGQRLAHRMRGSTAIHGSVDFGIYCDLKAHTPTSWENEVDGEMREGRSQGLFGLELAIVDENRTAKLASWTFHEDVKELPYKAKAKAKDGKGKKPKTQAEKKDAAKERVFEVLRGELVRDTQKGREPRAWSSEHVAEEAGVGASTCRRYLAELEREGRVIGTPRGFRALTQEQEDDDSEET